MTIATVVKVARRLADGPYGYGQDDRWGALADNGELGLAGLSARGDADCGTAVGISWYLGGLIRRNLLKGTWYSGNVAAKAKASGMFYLVNVAGWSLARINDTARIGAGLVGPGHVMMHVGGGKWLSFETTEKGTSTGGKAGDQTGREGRIRDLYPRSRGWTYLIQPYTVAELLTQAITAYRAGKDPAAYLERLEQRAPWDGPRWAWFMRTWAKWDRGVTLSFDATKLSVPQSGHAYVVLGSSIERMRRRLPVVLPGLVANPESKVLVTGGVVRAGKTEAAWMRDWLIGHGVAASRIITEQASGNTVYNAKNSVPLLLEGNLTSYTLVSDASHLRRAQILFLAARVQLETPKNRRLPIRTAGLLAYDDYSPKPIKTALPVNAASRDLIAGNVLTLLK